MSYCLNSTCQKPHNTAKSKFCINCGSRLVLSDRYRALKPIGQGGFGQTFLAVDESHAFKQQCVIKQLFPQDRSNFDKAADLFCQEASYIERLGSHPQIPHLLAYFEQGDRQYLVQEFVDGQNLAQELANEGAFSEIQIRQLLNNLLPVLQFVREQQMIHRDIKPENIIRRYQDGQLFLVDFGAAKLATGTYLAKTGTVIGSAGYAAPEQASGKAVFSSDLYSLGVTCIHLLTQVEPFDLYSFSEDTWVWRDYLDQKVSYRLGCVLDKLVERAIRKRYQSAEEVLQALAPSAPIGIRTIAAPTHISNNWRCVQTLNEHSDSVLSVAFSPDGSTLASCSKDDAIALRNVRTGESRTIAANSSRSEIINSIAISRDGHLVSGSSRSSTLKLKNCSLIKLWNLQTGKVSETINGSSKSVHAVAISPDSKVLATASADGTIRVWNLQTGSLIYTLCKHSGPVRCIAISVDGKVLASGGDDATMNLWNLQTGKLLRSIPAFYPLFSVAISPDLQTVFGSGYDYTVKSWNLETGKLLSIFCNHSNWVTAIAISPDGKTLASGSNDYKINLWNLETRKVIAMLNEHCGCINSVAFSPDGLILVSGSADTTIKLWQCD